VQQVGAGAQQGDVAGGRQERVGDRAAVVQRERGAGRAVVLGDEDLAGQRAGRVQRGEARQAGDVAGHGPADDDGGGGAHGGHDVNDPAVVIEAQMDFPGGGDKIT